MDMKTLHVLIILLCLPLFVQSQMWKKLRYDVSGGLGTNNFLGDLGGGPGAAKHFMSLKDIDFALTRPVIQVATRYYLYEVLAVKLGMSYARIKANDAESQEIGRNYRNMHFRSNIYETSVQVEFYILKDKGKTYVSQESSILNNLSIYLFFGVGGLYFNPRSELFNVWWDLKQFGTEGQYVPNSGVKPYKNFAASFPIGIGFQYNLDKRLGIGLELSNRYCSSDYIDDVGGTYYDNDMIREVMTEKLGPEKGRMASIFADRHIPWEGQKYYPNKGGTVYRSGNDYNDSYITLMVSVYYKLRSTRRGLPKFRG